MLQRMKGVLAHIPLDRTPTKEKSKHVISTRLQNL
jgi:hypothetical protein